MKRSRKPSLSQFVASVFPRALGCQTPGRNSGRVWVGKVEEEESIPREEERSRDSAMKNRREKKTA